MGGFNYWDLGFADVVHPLSPEGLPGTALITGLAAYDMFGDNLHACLGHETTLFGDELFIKNRLANCGLVLVDVTPVDEVITVGKQGTKQIARFKVVRNVQKGINEFLPWSDEVVDVAKNSDEVVKALPYLDDVSTTIVHKGRKLKVRRRFASDGKWLNHFTVHAHEVGVKTHQDYLQLAYNHSKKNADNSTIFRKLKKDRRSGRFVIYTYDKSTNEFSVVLESTGEILTYYLPRDGFNYYLSK